MKLKLWKRGFSAAAALALGPDAGPARLPPPIPLASGGFAEVLISAHETDIPRRRPSSWPSISGTAPAPSSRTGTLDFTTPVNRVTKDVELHCDPPTPSTSPCTVDYLTDLNGDGAYELLTVRRHLRGWDVLTAAGSLDRRQQRRLHRPDHRQPPIRISARQPAAHGGPPPCHGPHHQRQHQLPLRPHRLQHRARVRSSIW